MIPKLSDWKQVLEKFTSMIEADMQNGKQVYQYDFHNNLLYRMQYHLFEYFPSFSCYTIYFTHLYKRVKRQQNK